MFSLRTGGMGDFFSLRGEFSARHLRGLTHQIQSQGGCPEELGDDSCKSVEPVGEKWAFRKGLLNLSRAREGRDSSFMPCLEISRLKYCCHQTIPGHRSSLWGNQGRNSSTYSHTAHLQSRAKSINTSLLPARQLSSLSYSAGAPA